MSNSNICRSCLQSSETMFSIFNFYNKIVIAQLIEELTGIKIVQNDGLPEFICKNCAFKFKQSLELRELFLKSDSILKKSLSQKLFNKPTVKSPSNNKKLRKIKPASGDTKNSLLPLDKMEIAEYFDGMFETEDDYLEEIDLDLLSENDEAHSSDEESTSSTIVPMDPSTIIECVVCKKQLSTVKSLQRHQNYHNLKKTKCPLCKKEFTHKSNLKRHIYIHKNKSPPYRCDRCEQIFHILTELYEHVKVHSYEDESKSDDYVINCELCAEQTKSLAAFYMHMQIIHNVQKKDVKPFKCQVCGMSFTSKQGMYRHIDNIHENNRRNLRNRDKNFLCTECGKSFYTNFHLEIHTRAHTGERPFKCPVENCGKSFSQQSGYKMHSHVHTKERPFSCNICGKRFSQHGHVTEHMMTHSDLKPHACSICSRAFRIKGNLTAHMLIHTGKKKHICTCCGKQFLQSSKLKAHFDKFHQHQSNQLNAGTTIASI